MELIKANLNNRNKRFVWICLALQTDIICLTGGDVRIQCWFLNLFRDTHECELSFDIVMEILLLFSSTNLMRLHCVVQQDMFIHSFIIIIHMRKRYDSSYMGTYSFRSSSKKIFTFPIFTYDLENRTMTHSSSFQWEKVPCFFSPIFSTK